MDLSRELDERGLLIAGGLVFGGALLVGYGQEMGRVLARYHAQATGRLPVTESQEDRARRARPAGLAVYKSPRRR